MSFEEMNLKDTLRPGGRNCVMVHGFDGFEVDRIGMAADRAGIDEWIYIDEERIKQGIKSTIDSSTSNEGVGFRASEDQFVLFHGCSNHEIHQFINELLGFAKKRPLIAVTTPVSLTWSFTKLVQELKKEREAL